jgi:hypothetical protein
MTMMMMIMKRKKKKKKSWKYTEQAVCGQQGSWELDRS